MAEPTWSLKKVALGRVYENLPLATLQQWILEARIDPDDELRAAGASEWQRADRVPELARYFAPESGGVERLDAGVMGRGLRRRRDEGISVDLTPFIDITFLLLIFFVVSAQFSHRSMKIDPPSAKNVESRKQEKLIVVLTKAGEIFIGEEQIRLQDLAARIKDEMLRRQQQSVVIKGDRDAQHGLFVKVLDRCKEANVQSIFVGAVKEKD